ncbi:macro domain-containing protein, partial [Staphylococcus haemolyticus]|uniref:macro domain-containing protein n=1 Tax=Staphylococcus haemolyticus TaxID=1283 RepID=UPI00374E7B68
MVKGGNRRLLGCMEGNEEWIDKMIHRKGGVELGVDCGDIIEEEGGKEGVGKAKVRSGYNLAG